jgi:5-methylcytosine-specific restriction endonuclease McrA
MLTRADFKAIYDEVMAMKFYESEATRIDPEEFYSSRDWRKLRYEVLRKNRKCGLCGDDRRLHVDHIKPISKYPSLALNLSNLQILCEDCNLGKSNIYEDNWT